MRDISVNISFTPEWWDAHFHKRSPRPPAPSRQALESTYLKRLRFLFEHFEPWGLGNSEPKPGGQLATVIRHGFDMVPALLGTPLTLTRAAWGLVPRYRPLASLADLGAVDFANHPEAEYVILEKERLTSLYGSCKHMVDIGSVCNNAFRIIGDELYTALLSDREPLARLFEAILTTERSLYNFLEHLFPGTDWVPIANCNVHLMGPRLYEEHVLPYDIRQNLFHADLCGGPPLAILHHCDVAVDDFVACYSRLPGLDLLEASYTSDIGQARRLVPDCKFSAIVSPKDLTGTMSVFRHRLGAALSENVAVLNLWNIDPVTSTTDVRSALKITNAVCSEHQYRPVFSAQALSWEELEWAHGQYKVGSNSP